MGQVPEWRPTGPQYLYVAVAEHLVKRIEAGDLPPGSRLPSESYLCDEYDVSMPTVRHALSILRERGLVVTLPANGTFVTEPEDEANGS